MIRRTRSCGRCFCAIVLSVTLATGLPPFAASDPIDGTWEQLTPGGTTPPWRKYFAAIYDPLRQRLVADGGWPGPYLDTWALSLSDQPVWTKLYQSGSYFGRSRHSGIYDPIRDRMLIFGWDDGDLFGYKNAVLEMRLSGAPAWHGLSPAGPIPVGRILHTLVYDPLRDRMLVFGGQLWGLGYANEVWELSLSGTPTWSLLTTTGGPPTPRVSHSAIYDPVQDAMFVFGGTTLSGKTTEVWQLALSGTPTWSLIATVGTPPDGRDRHSAIYDPVRDRMVIFGGFSTGNVPMNDVWALSLSGTLTWSQLAPQGTLPAVREGHRAIYDAPRDRMVVYGGELPPEDLWALNWGTPVAVETTKAEPTSLTLQVRPNPMEMEAAVEFSLPGKGAVRVGIYDVRGALIRSLMEGAVPAGLQRLRWDRTTDHGQRATSGVYFLHLRSDAGSLTRRFLLVD